MSVASSVGSIMTVTNVDPLRGIVSVAWFGTVGDGVTDDTAAVQTALNTYQHLFFPWGTYLVDPLVLYSGASLLGAGRGATTLKLKTSGADLLTGSLIDKITLKGLNFLGTADRTATERLVFFDQCEDVAVQGCGFRDAVIGMQAQSSTDVLSEGNHFKNMVRKNDGSQGYGHLFNLDNEGVMVRSCTFREVERHAVYFSSGSSYCTAMGNKSFDGNGIAFNVNAKETQNPCKAIVITANQVRGTTRRVGDVDDLAMISATGKVDMLHITGNVLVDGDPETRGVYVQSSALDSSQIQNVQIAGNTVKDVGSHGVHILNGRNVSVFDNDLLDCGGHAISAGVSGTDVGSILDRVTCYDNTILRAGGFGCSFTGKDASRRLTHLELGPNRIEECGSGRTNINSFVDVEYLRRV